MRKVIGWLPLLVALLVAMAPYSASALLSLELNRGMAGAIPIAIVPFGTQGAVPPQNVSGIITNDLQNSGRFKVYGQNVLKQFPTDITQVSNAYFRQLGTDAVVIGHVNALSDGQYQVSFQLLDGLSGQVTPNVALGKTYTVSGTSLRAVAHHISDLIYEQMTGVRGVFSTRLVYVVVQRAPGTPARYLLEVADMDGYNPRPLLDSPEPVMSPAWSPNGKQVAYVSFENKQAEIYLQNAATGSRQLLSRFPGINGAPAWSPDGRKLALVLSKGGTPDIYVMDIGSHALTRLTNDFAINTEPSWSPDGQSLIFTSNRGGGPQIYQINLASRAVTRMTYDGDYNARASYTHDGKHIAMIHRVSGIYKIAVLDLDTGTTRVLTGMTDDSASPSIAPNGSMILYDTRHGGRNMLGMVSSDGRIQLLLPARNGEAQDPAWSPFLS